MQASRERWFRRRTYSAPAPSVAELLAAKGGASVSVVLPAQNEAATVGEIVRALADDLQEPGLVDEILVIDSHSTDATAAVAASAGARVVRQSEILPRLGDRPGKGEAMWKALAVARGELVVFLDADLRDFSTAFVTGLVAPLLQEPSVHFVKGMYERPLTTAGGVSPAGGGRVTELMARPLLNAFWPELAGFVQPLAGEYAARRCVLERVPFVGGYGVEVGLLIDLLELLGLDALAQADLGRRVHRHQSDEALGAMAMQIQLTAYRRLERQGRLVAIQPPQTRLTQFRRGPEGFTGFSTDVDAGERPPMAEVRDVRQPESMRS